MHSQTKILRRDTRYAKNTKYPRNSLFKVNSPKYFIRVYSVKELVYHNPAGDVFTKKKKEKRKKNR